MIFTDSADEMLHRELMNAQVYTLKEYGAMALPPEGRLMDVLVANAERINTGKWIAWLVQRHACTRMAVIEPSMDWVSGLTFEPKELRIMAEKDLYPIEHWNGAVLVACCRPDALPFLDLIRIRAGADKAFAVAATPAEIKSIRSAFSSHGII